MPHRRVFSAVLAAFLFSGWGCGGGPRNEDLTLGYRVTAAEGGFRVEVRVAGLGDRHPRMRLLNGWGMLQDQADNILDVRAEDDQGELSVSRETEIGETFWEMSRRPRGELVLRYRVRSHDLFSSPEASFSGPESMVLLGYSLFLLPEGLRHNDPVAATVDLVAPPDWPVWSSWPGESSSWSPPTPHDLWSGIVVAGAFSPTTLGRSDVSVTVLTDPKVQGATGLTIANRLLPVLREMESYFGAPPRGDELHILALYRVLPARGNQSVIFGTSEENAFLCLATPDRYQTMESLTTLATHECLHFYLGGAISADPEPPYRNAPELVWLMEGVTEYLTYELMGRAGVLTSEQIAKIAEKKDRDYRRTPGWKTLTLADAARHMGDFEIYELVYTRGYLVGKLLDEELARCVGPEALAQILRELFENDNFYDDKVVIDPGRVREVFEAHCPGIWPVVNAFALENTVLPTPETEPAAHVQLPRGGSTSSGS